MTPVVAAVVAACCFGGQVLLVDAILRERSRSVLAVTAITLVGSVALLWSLAAALGRLSLAALPESLVVLAPFVVAGVADPALTRYLYYEGIARVGSTVAASITAGSPAVATLLAVLVLGETVTPLTGLGVALVVAGIVGVQRTTDDGTGGRLADLVERGARFPLAAMVVIGGAFVVVETGLARFSRPVVATALTQSVALLAVLGALCFAPAARRDVGRFAGREYGLLTLAGCVAAVAWYATFVALDAGSVVVVAPVASAYPVVVALGESVRDRRLVHGPRTLLAAAVVVLGAALVRLS